MDGNRRGRLHKHEACFRCHRPMLCGDWAWLVLIPAARIRLDGTSERIQRQVLMCDTCGAAA